MRVLALTGAGVSAESGISTFRDQGGLWENHRMDEVATPKAFSRDPKLVWHFYKERWEQSLAARPNPAHYALAELERALGADFHLITQNVDGLHSLAGNSFPIEMHGYLRRCFCTQCRTNYALADLDLRPAVPSCPACGGILRPDIVWFGEIPYHLERIDGLLKSCDVFLLVGTSGVVYPAAGFVMTAKLLGARTVSINPDPASNSEYIDEFHQGKAGELLPRLVKTWLTD